jgi:hypothetical protein
MLSWANFRARLPEHVPKLEKVAQRSPVALVVVREIDDRRCARSGYFWWRGVFTHYLVSPPWKGSRGFLKLLQASEFAQFYVSGGV